MEILLSYEKLVLRVHLSAKREKQQTLGGQPTLERTLKPKNLKQLTFPPASVPWENQK